VECGTYLEAQEVSMMAGSRESLPRSEAADDVVFWAIEYAMNPSSEERSCGLLCMPLPWDEGEIIQAALMIFESRTLAKAGLEHYLAWTGQDHTSSYRLLPLTSRELIEILEARPEGGGFDYVAINPIMSLYFRSTVGYSAGSRTDDFINDLKMVANVNHS